MQPWVESIRHLCRSIIIGSKSYKKVIYHSSLPVVLNLRYVSRATMTHLAVNILACQCRIYTKPPAFYPKKPAYSKSACEIEQTGVLYEPHDSANVGSCRHQCNRYVPTRKTPRCTCVLYRYCLGFWSCWKLANTLRLGEDTAYLNSWYYREETEEKESFYSDLHLFKGCDDPNLLSVVISKPRAYVECWIQTVCKGWVL